MILAIYLLAGACAGLVAGLFGVGGGIVVVPVLVVVFESQGFDAQILTHMAIGTSLATIVFTSISSVVNHHRLGSVDWNIFKPMSVGIVLGSVIGVVTVLQLDGELVKKLIGGFAIFVAFKMFLQSSVVSTKEVPEGFCVMTPVGVFVGWVSSIFGIGGGTLTVPFLSRYNIEMKKVVGTAAACGLPIAIAGALTNIVMGIDLPHRPAWSLGYVYLPALFGIAVASTYFAKVGAKLAHKLPADLLKKLFAVTLFVVGLKFLFF
jgi:uncharacterized membrane protein YfcA